MLVSLDVDSSSDILVNLFQDGLADSLWISRRLHPLSFWQLFKVGQVQKQTQVWMEVYFIDIGQCFSTLITLSHHAGEFWELRFPQKKEGERNHNP